MPNWATGLAAGITKAGEGIGAGLLQRGKNKISIMDILGRDQLKELQRVQEEMDMQGSASVRATLGEDPAASGEELGRAYIAGGGMANKGSTLANQLTLATSRALQSKQELNLFVAQKASIRGIKGVDAPSAVDMLVGGGYDPGDPMSGQAVLEGMLNFSKGNNKSTLKECIQTAANNNKIKQLPRTSFWNPTPVEPSPEAVKSLGVTTETIKKELFPSFYDEKDSSATAAPVMPTSTPAETPTATDKNMVRVRYGEKTWMLPRSALSAAKQRGAVEVP